MAPTAYQVLTSIASPGAVDSRLQLQAKAMITPTVDADLNGFVAARPHSPCFTAGSTFEPLEVRMTAPLMACKHVAWLTHGRADVYNSTYGRHYRNEHGVIEKSNLFVVGHPPANIIGLIENAMREKLRANPAQSKQQSRISDSVFNGMEEDELGTVYVIAAPDGPRDVFLEADMKHKALCALYRWCVDPKNKNKKEDDYKPYTPPITNDVTAFETITKLLDA